MKKGLVEFLAIAFPKAINGGLTIFFNVLLLRHLGPEHYGAYSLCIGMILLVDGTVGSAIDLGVLRLSTERRLAAAHGGYTAIDLAGFLMKLLAGALAGGLLLSVADPLGNALFKGHGGADLLALTLAAALGLLLLRSVSVYLQSTGRFLLYGCFDLIHSLLKFGGVGWLILGWAAEPEPGQVLRVFALAPFLALLPGLLVFFRGGRAGGGSTWQALGDLAGQIKWFLASYVVTASVSRMDIFMVTQFSSLEQTGILSGGQTFAAIPELLGTYIAVVLNPRVIPYCRENRFLPFLRKFQWACLLAGLAIFAVAALGKNLLADLLLPPAFAPSVEVLLVLLPGTLVSMAVFPLVLPYLMFVRPRFFLTMDLLSLPLLFILYVYAIEQQGALGAAWVTSLARAGKGILAQLLALRLAARPDTIRTDASHSPLAQQ